MDEITTFFQKLRFRKRLFGGVSEPDVWRRLDELQRLYRSVYDAQQARIDELERLLTLRNPPSHEEQS